jgi:hypothetical protein
LTIFSGFIIDGQSRQAPLSLGHFFLMAANTSLPPRGRGGAVAISDSLFDLLTEREQPSECPEATAPLLDCFCINHCAKLFPRLALISARLA